ncbi:hypothetical protein [Dactylosporangium sp. CS-033363]|uniref:hypothetical protein n=1 Tax=Dactylosporangium sp. CS-033363 TaxID=3239935 RepID=UPI003D8FE342
MVRLILAESVANIVRWLRAFWHIHRAVFHAFADAPYWPPAAVAAWARRELVPPRWRRR